MKPRDSFDRLSARITVQTAAWHELTKADAFTVNTKQCCEIQSVGTFDFKRRFAEQSVYAIKVPREPFKSIGFICSLYSSRGTLMSYTDQSAQRRLKSNAPNVRTQAEQEKHCVQRDSQKAFKSAHHYYLPWIYCSNTHCIMVLWQKCGIFTLDFITGVMVYNYSTYVWLRQL